MEKGRSSSHKKGPGIATTTLALGLALLASPGCTEVRTATVGRCVVKDAYSTNIIPHLWDVGDDHTAFTAAGREIRRGPRARAYALGGGHVLAVDAYDDEVPAEVIDCASGARVGLAPPGGGATLLAGPTAPPTVIAVRCAGGAACPRYDIVTLGVDGVEVGRRSVDVEALRAGEGTRVPADCSYTDVLGFAGDAPFAHGGEGCGVLVLSQPPRLVLPGAPGTDEVALTLAVDVHGEWNHTGFPYSFAGFTVGSR